MFAVKAQITGCIDDSSHPSFVECQFVDARGCIQIFHDKDAIFTVEHLDKSSQYPLNGVVGCEILEMTSEILKITTGHPWGIVSINEEFIFEVLQEQLIELEYLE